MIIDLVGLNTNHVKEIIVEKKYKFSDEQISTTDLINLSEVNVSGNIKKDSLGEIVIDVYVIGTMTLPCAITLKPVEHKFSININGNLYELLNEIDENIKKTENSIDILPIIWENILMEIPMKVVSEEASSINLEGEGWKLVTNEEKKINPALASLSDLLKK